MTELKTFIDEQAMRMKDTNISWTSFSDYRGEYLRYDPKELLLTCLNHNRLTDGSVGALLVCLPEVWKDFNIDDWKYLIENVNRPITYKLLFDDMPCFEDIKFIYKFLEIDSISLYKKDRNISQSNRESLDMYIPFMCTYFFKKRSDRLGFEDGTYGDIKYFEEMRKRLLSQGASPAPFTKDAITETLPLREYIKNF